MEETGLHIPAVVEVSKIDGKWAIISEFIPGKTLDRLMQENPEKLDEYLNLLLTCKWKSTPSVRRFWAS